MLTTPYLYKVLIPCTTTAATAVSSGDWSTYAGKPSIDVTLSQVQTACSALDGTFFTVVPSTTNALNVLERARDIDKSVSRTL